LPSSRSASLRKLTLPRVLMGQFRCCRGDDIARKSEFLTKVSTHLPQLSYPPLRKENALPLLLRSTYTHLVHCLHGHFQNLWFRGFLCFFSFLRGYLTRTSRTSPLIPKNVNTILPVLPPRQILTLGSVPTRPFTFQRRSYLPLMS
jgi:hypothetical protein